jgi:hypothetical protein
VSVLDDLRRAQDQLVARLQELEPLVSEYQELRQVADRLGLPADAQAGEPAAASATAEPVADEPAAPAPKRPSRRRRAAKPADRSVRRQPGGSRGPSREEQLLNLIAENPGITVTAAGKQLGVDPTGLYRPVRKLVADGRIDKQGAELHPAGGS